MNRGGRLLSILTVSFSLLLLVQITDAGAVLLANRSSSSTTTTGNWSTRLATATGAPLSAAYQITWTGNSNKQNELISIVNTGNFDLTALHLNFSSAKANGDTSNPPTLTFETCSGTWDTTTFSCSGTVTQIGNATSGQINVNRYLIAGNRLVIKVSNARNSTGNYISTFNSQTYRSDMRFGLVFNS